MALFEKHIIGGFLASCLIFGVSAGMAQDPKTDPQQPQQPITPAGANDSANSGAVVPYSKEEPSAEPDTRPLAGFQKLSLGTNQADHSFLLPSFSVVGQVQSNPYLSGQVSNTNVTGSGSITGRLALNRITSVSSLSLDYLTGASFSGDSGQGTSGIQSLDFSDTFHRGRWSLLVGDQLMYLSQSPFGFGGLGGLNGYGVPLGNGGVGTGSGLDGVSPDQTILTNGARISNGVVGQTDYALSHRSSLTIGANYGVLKYIGDGFNNNSTVSFQSGYNYQLNRKDTVTVAYHYGRFMFANGTPGFQNHSIEFGYARRITGRLSFQIAAGPDIQMYAAPLKGSSELLSWTLSSSLNYSHGSFGAGLNYSHAVNAGSGVLNGAESDTVAGTLSQALNRDWNGSLGFGFSKNRALQQTTANANSISPQVWFFSARVSRRFFANGNLFLNYSLSKQSSLASICTLPACQVGAMTHTGSIGYTWGLRRIILE